MEDVFVRIWYYTVPESNVGAFLAAYGSEGPWARLFRQGRGYEGTDSSVARTGPIDSSRGYLAY